jgi:DNA-binding CsgD family transcriptional regulator/tetratricopeptide (TPR) repeat protein
VASFSAALRFVDGAQPHIAADLHQRLATEASLVERWRAAVEAGERSASLWSEVADPLREGDALRLRSAMTWRTANGAQSSLLAEEALRRLRPLGPTPELARTYAQLGALRVLQGDLAAGIEKVTEARALAEELQLPDVRSHTVMTAAMVAWRQGRAWADPARQAVHIARRADAHEAAARAYANLHTLLRWSFDFAAADECYAEAAAFCDRYELTTYSLYLRSSHAAALASRGKWDEAAAICRGVLAERPSPTTRIDPNLVLGLILTRRADPSGLQHLDEAVGLATRADFTGLRCAALLARVEAHWLDDAHDPALADVDLAAGIAASADPWTRGHVAVWQRRLGTAVTVRCDDGPEPYARALGRDFGSAAKLWDDLGAPYEASLALLDAGTEAALRQALQRFQALGAAAAERATRRRMRSLGIRGIPSGAHHSTRANPAGLTRREHEVLLRVGAGRTNAQIADELVISPRTVDHHVSALLTKLGASSRAMAVERAVALGLLAADRRPAPQK